MKKILSLILALLLILSMAVPAYAVTPDLQTPSISIPDISDDVQKNLEEQYDFSHAVDNWLEEHPIEIPDPTEAPTEPPEEPEPVNPWCGWLHKWLRWWRDKIC